MTSKEALEMIVVDLVPKAKENNKEEIELIEKDLEVLEILKNESDDKKIIERNGIISFHLNMILTHDNYGLIKEWVNNHKYEKA